MSQFDDQYVRNVVRASEMAAANLEFWVIELIVKHDEAKEGMTHEDDYQNGYLHGLNTAIEFMRSKLPEIEQHKIEMQKLLKEKGTDDQEQSGGHDEG